MINIICVAASAQIGAIAGTCRPRGRRAELTGALIGLSWSVHGGACNLDPEIRITNIPFHVMVMPNPLPQPVHINGIFGELDVVDGRWKSYLVGTIDTTLHLGWDHQMRETPRALSSAKSVCYPAAVGIRNGVGNSLLYDFSKWRAQKRAWSVHNQKQCTFKCPLPKRPFPLAAVVRNALFCAGE